MGRGIWLAGSGRGFGWRNEVWEHARWDLIFGFERMLCAS